MKKRSIPDKILWLVSRSCLAGGLGGVALGAGFAVYTGIFLARSVSTTGTVVRLEPKTDQQDGSINYSPIFTFTAVDGRTYTVGSGVASNPPEFDPGESVKVRYVRSDPGGARIATFLQFWFVTVVAGGLGTFYTLLGYLFLRWDQKRMRRKAPLTAMVEGR